MNYDQQRDDFALLFLNWVSKNYRQMSQNTYCHISDFQAGAGGRSFLALGELLAQFKKEYIPLSSEMVYFPDKALSMLEQQMMRVEILFSGMTEIQIHALQNGAIDMQALLAIISSTIKKFTQSNV